MKDGTPNRDIENLADGECELPMRDESVEFSDLEFPSIDSSCSDDAVEISEEMKIALEQSWIEAVELEDEMRRQLRSRENDEPIFKSISSSGKSAADLLDEMGKTLI